MGLHDSKPAWATFSVQWAASDMVHHKASTTTKKIQGNSSIFTTENYKRIIIYLRNGGNVHRF